MRILYPFCCILLLITAAPLQAQSSEGDDPRLVSAVAPLPEEFRATATVLTHDAAEVLREGEGAFICLAHDPVGERFHAACYHRSLEPFMRRGRELRAQGFTTEVDSLREKEIAGGDLEMPDHPAALYSLTGPAGAFDTSTGEIQGARQLFVIYVPFATAETTGLPTRPRAGAPWLMDPGTAKAHIMFVPEM